MSERLGLPRGLLAICVAVALLVIAPVAVTIVQAIEGGFHALSTALRAPATGVARAVTATVCTSRVSGAEARMAWSAGCTPPWSAW